MAIQKLRDVIRPHAPKILVYGRSGTGKTTLIGSLPGRVLIVSAEAGLLSLRQFSEDDRFDVLEINRIEDLQEAFEVAASDAYDWVALDSASEIAEVLLATAKAATKDPRQAYGEIIDRMLSLLRDFRNLKCGVYITAKEEFTKDESTGRLMYSLSMPGSKLGPAVPYLFDEVFRLMVVDNREPDGKTVREHILQTAGDVGTVAKDRSGTLESFEAADLGAIVTKIIG